MSQEIFAKIKAEVESEDFDKSKVRQLLKNLEADYLDTVENLRIANSESKKRKEKIRDELLPKIEEYEDRIAVLEKKSDTSNLEQQLTELQKYKLKVLESNKKKFMETFDKISQHEKFEKAKDKFVLPEATEDGKYDFTKLDDSSIEKNLDTLEFLNSLDYFTTQKENKPPVFGNRFNELPKDEKPEFKKRSDVNSFLKNAIKEKAIK